VGFFAWLQDEYVALPAGAAPRAPRWLSQKSIRNIHTSLSALWTWAVDEGYAAKHLVRAMRPPAATPPVIEPFTKEEIAALLKAFGHSRPWRTHPDKTSTRLTADRDRAILLVLVDTGIRASELSGIRFADLDQVRSKIRVRGKGPGREGKERVVFFGRRTAQALWRHLLPRSAGSLRPEDFVFTAGPLAYQAPLTPDRLTRLVRTIGERAGVKHVHPHRFRHTYAITNLRNGGNALVLWHGLSLWLRKLVSQTLVVLFCQQMGLPA
jgi:integrase